MDRPITTVFMLMPVDGKISTGSTDELDVDRDFPRISGVREGLHQYYEIEQTTDLWSFNTGRVQVRMGVNEKKLPDKTPVSFVLLDNHHLTEHRVRCFCVKSKQAVVITSNASHPAFYVDTDNLHIRGNKMARTKSQSFEESLNRLEEIVRRLDDGSVPLEEAMKLFQEGTGLAARCSKLLDRAELEVVKLTKSPEGTIEEVPFANDQLT